MTLESKLWKKLPIFLVWNFSFLLWTKNSSWNLIWSVLENQWTNYLIKEHWDQWMLAQYKCYYIPCITWKWIRHSNVNYSHFSQKSFELESIGLFVIDISAKCRLANFFLHKHGFVVLKHFLVSFAYYECMWKMFLHLRNRKWNRSIIIVFLYGHSWNYKKFAEHFWGKRRSMCVRSRQIVWKSFDSIWAVTLY